MLFRYEPSWVIEARTHIGLKEIPGPKHNPTILKWANSLGRKLGISVTDDETPWCGTFVAHCMQVAKVDPPPIAVRAKSWATWGEPMTRAIYGAVLVFERPGGGHVGLYVGEDLAAYHVLGGNQSNSVNITRIEKARCIAIRWPSYVPVTGNPLLLAANGSPLSTNEA